jgi:hypothetical protein
MKVSRDYLPDGLRETSNCLFPNDFYATCLKSVAEPVDFSAAPGAYKKFFVLAP